MRSRFPAFLLPFFTIPALAQPPAGYYDNAQGLSGPALKAALHDIINDHTVYAYSQLWSFFPTTDDRPDGYVWDIYSDVPGGQAPYLYTFGTDQCGTYSDEGDCYNREHSFPQNWFNSTPPMSSDLHHIYPTDGYVNNRRGDLPYGRVGSASWTGLNGSRTGPSNWPGYSNTVFEPINAFKGDLARTYFYMMTRYLPQVPNWSSDMLAAGDLNIWATNLLLQWHAQDPVDQKEVDRNNAIFGIQANRNPFIDHPEWVVYIWGPTAAVADGIGPEGTRMWSDGERLHVEGTMPDGRRIMLLDAMGRQVWYTTFTSPVMSLPAMAPGAYLLRMDGVRALRFVR